MLCVSCRLVNYLSSESCSSGLFAVISVLVVILFKPLKESISDNVGFIWFTSASANSDKVLVSLKRANSLSVRSGPLCDLKLINCRLGKAEMLLHQVQTY